MKADDTWELTYIDMEHRIFELGKFGEGYTFRDVGEGEVRYYGMGGGSSEIPEDVLDEIDRRGLTMIS